MAFIYGQFWKLAERASFRDAKLLQWIQEYPNCTITIAAAKGFHCHLWYFSKNLVGLAFFDLTIMQERHGRQPETTAKAEISQKT